MKNKSDVIVIIFISGIILAYALNFLIKYGNKSNEAKVFPMQNIKIIETSIDPDFECDKDISLDFTITNNSSKL